MQRRHAMPFGAELDPEGGVDFRLWAPDHDGITLELEVGPGAPASLPLERRVGGWHALRVPAAAAGTRYRFRLPDGLAVPDPASRRQPEGVHGPSEVIDPAAFVWDDHAWHGRPWAETVLYELHIGAFTPEGTFAAAAERLPELARLGVTAVELMPVAAFPGERNWGYDGVALFAPAAAYGTPAKLKAFVAAAHRAGLMVFLDVVYNHFGPEGNYLHAYARDFFTAAHATPWGDAIQFGGAVRDFYAHNALYWLEEYNIDGLRFDAVHAIHDTAQPDILHEIAARVRAALPHERQVHLVLENDANQARYLERDPAGRPRAYVAQWNDDVHHALHCLLTDEETGYYADYQPAARDHLGRCLTEGFAYQGERSAFRDGEPRGERSAHLPLTAFVGFLQNHDQIGNRAHGERLTRLAGARAVQAAQALLLLAPAPPLLFMGEEYGSRQPFLFFCDFGPDLAASVTAGRRREFARFAEFADPQAAARIPDPQAAETFARSRLDWDARTAHEHAAWLEEVRRILALRQTVIVPRLPALAGGRRRWTRLGERALYADWTAGGGALLSLFANFGAEAIAGLAPPRAPLLWESAPGAAAALGTGRLAHEAVIWFWDPGEGKEA